MQLHLEVIIFRKTIIANVVHTDLLIFYHYKMLLTKCIMCIVNNTFVKKTSQKLQIFYANSV